MPPTSTKSQNGLTRGDACFACRVRKLKCDGSLPVCGRCRLKKRECLYTGLMPRPRPTETLELRALELERQIEHLLDPHNKALSFHRVFEQIRMFGETPRRQNRPPTTTIMIYPYSLSSFVPRAVVDNLFEGWRPESGISTERRLYLVRLFLPRRTYWNLSCNPEKLLERSALPPTNPRALHPALLNAIYLVVCTTAGGVLQHHVPYFVEETKRQLQSSLAFADRIVHFLWASMIYHVWLARASRFAESYTCIISTLRFALGCGLAGGSPGDCILPPPQTLEDAVDRIHLVHAIYQSDHSLSMYSMFGSVLELNNQPSDSPSSPYTLFRRALQFPLEVWPDLLSLKNAAGCLDSVLLLRTATSLLHERAEGLISKIFARDSLTLQSDSLHGDGLREFNSIRSDLETLHPILPSYTTLPSGQLGEDVDPAIIPLHGSYHGTVIILYSIVAMLNALGHHVPGVELQEARRRSLEASDALVSIALVYKIQEQPPSRIPQALLFIHFTNAVLVYVRELKRSMIRPSPRQITAWCDSLSILMEVLQNTLSVVPIWVHLANSIRQFLPASPTQLDLSTEQVDLLSFSSILRVSV